MMAKEPSSRRSGRSKSAACRSPRRGVVADEWPPICASLEALPIRVEVVSLSRVWGSALALANRHELSVYDATYLELALRMRLPLAMLAARQTS